PWLTSKLNGVRPKSCSRGEAAFGDTVGEPSSAGVERRAPPVALPDGEVQTAARSATAVPPAEGSDRANGVGAAAGAGSTGRPIKDWCGCHAGSASRNTSACDPTDSECSTGAGSLSAAGA